MNNTGINNNGPELVDALGKMMEMANFIRDNNVPAKRDQQQQSPAKSEPAQSKLQKQEHGQVAKTTEPKTGARIDFEKQYKASTWEGLVDLAWYNGALAADKTGTPITAIPGMFYGRGGKRMLEALRDPEKRKQIYDSLLGRQLTDSEMHVQFCNSIIASMKNEELIKALENPNSLYHAAMTMKLKLEESQRNVMLTDLKLRGTSSSPVNIEQAGQVFIGQPQGEDKKADDTRDSGDGPLQNRKISKAREEQ